VRRPSAVVVLAAGEGTRMRSSLPKVLHDVVGRALLSHVLDLIAPLDAHHVVVVVGHGRDLVAAHLEQHPGVLTAVQDQQNGTGHAVRIALEQVAGQGIDVAALGGPVVVVSGDSPLTLPETLVELIDVHEQTGAAATVLTAVLADPTGYGRILRDGDSVEAIVEQKDATEEQRLLTEVNSGVYAFDPHLLGSALGRVSTDNAQGEEYLTDVLAILRADGGVVSAVTAGHPDEILGVNDRVQLAQAGAVLRDRACERWMRSGVTIVDPATTWIGAQVVLGPDTVLLPNTHLHGSTRVGSRAVIGPDTTLVDTVVGDDAHVRRSEATSSEIGDHAEVGPFSYLRAGSRLGRGVKVGAYVEVKNATIGAGSKVPHLSYVGDATIGEGTNIGAATVFVNYDGVAKHHTTVGDHVRIGSDTMLVAPVVIGDGAYTAAGSVITEDVPAGAMAIARERQSNIEGWVQKRRPNTKSADAARAAQQQDDDQQNISPGAMS
jgi:bifunctional UDP-N-acetylglucosamine pyrophosphorylase / glucosamine-1-phosphate N-acetyltransferase